MRPSPHRRLTWHRSPWGWQAQVMPAPEAPTAATQGWRSSLPSLQAQHPVPPRGIPAILINMRRFAFYSKHAKVSQQY
jgi:hypothetical protein